MGKLTLIYLGLAMWSPVFAQTAASFDSQLPPAEDSSAVPGVAASGAADQKSAVDSTPSRLIEPGQLKAYLAKKSAAFLIQDRLLDVFGLSQDPAAEQIAATTKDEDARPVPVVPTVAFAEIVNLIVVTTIMPGEKKFLYGTRIYRQGDKLPLTFHGRPLQVQVTEVSSQQLTFRNQETGESVVRKLDSMPDGMNSGGASVGVPGMVADRPDAATELEPGESAP